MTLRIIPCTECRQHRRKCVRLDSNIKCSRCEKFGKICQQPLKKEKQQQLCKLDEYQDENSLQNQVQQLEKVIHFMEQELRTYHCNRSSNIQPLSELSNTMIQSLFQNWKISIKNGNFQIETGIRNISELLQFDPTISYLSPLSFESSSSSVSSASNSFFYSEGSYYRGGDAGIIMIFEKESTDSLVPFTISILTKSLVIKPSKPPVVLSMPSPLLLDPNTIDQLLHIYFQCHNIYKPLVHERSYREKLATIQDPLTDLVTLGICSYVCATPCEHLLFAPRERRNMGDYFYAKAREIILDQFDLPEKRLENVMGINLLTQYMHITLKFADSRQLVYMAYQILIDLRNDYPEFREPGPNVDIEGASYSEHFTSLTHQEPITDVDKMLFTRHIAVSAILSRLMDYIANDTTDKGGFSFPYWMYIADEPDETIRYIRSNNWIINLHNNEFIKNFMNSIRHVQLGRACALSFESIIRAQDVIKEYTNNVPAELRLCDDLNDVRLCYDVMEKTTDSVLLMNFIHFHIFIAGIYSCLLQPKALTNQDQQLLSLVQQHSLSQALKSCQLLIHGIHRLAIVNMSSCNYLVTASEYLFHALDVLILLALSPNKQIAKEAASMMSSCLEELDMIILTQGHQVLSAEIDSSQSTTNIFKVKDGVFDVSYYDQFPQPWLAIMYDASHYIASQQ